MQLSWFIFKAEQIRYFVMNILKIVATINNQCIKISFNFIKTHQDVINIFVHTISHFVLSFEIP